MELSNATARVAGTDGTAAKTEVTVVVDGSGTEAQERLVQLLRDSGHALPSGVNERVPDAQARPDLVFRSTSPVAVFIREDDSSDPERDARMPRSDSSTSGGTSSLWVRRTSGQPRSPNVPMSSVQGGSHPNDLSSRQPGRCSGP